MYKAVLYFFKETFFLIYILNNALDKENYKLTTEVYNNDNVIRNKRLIYI